MTNVILVNLISRLEKIEYTHNYIFGFVLNSLVYSYETVGLNTGIKLDRASSKCGGGYSLRYKPTKKELTALIASGICKVVCTENYFLDMVANSKYNKGEIFEKLITESFGIEWFKDNIRFDKGADIEINNKAYSVKFQGATIATENTITNIENGR